MGKRPKFTCEIDQKAVWQLLLWMNTGTTTWEPFVRRTALTTTNYSRGILVAGRFNKTCSKWEGGKNWSLVGREREFKLRFKWKTGQETDL